MNGLSDKKKAYIRFFNNWFSHESNLNRRKNVQEWWQCAYDILYAHIQKLVSPYKILYLGCGLGTDLDLRKFDGSKNQIIFGDLNFKGLVKSREVLAPGSSPPSLVCLDMEKSCFKDSSIDIIIIINALMCTEKEEALRNCHKMLSPDGMLILIEPLKYNPFTYVNRLREVRYRDISISCLELKDIEKITGDWNVIFNKEFFLFSPAAFFLYNLLPVFPLKKFLDCLMKWDTYLLEKLSGLRTLGALGVYVLEKKPTETT